MTDQEQRIVIAEYCGWQPDQNWGKKHWHKGTQLAYENELPDYLSDLNEMHEAEETLESGAVYLLVLRQVLNLCDPGAVPSLLGSGEAYVCAHATAPQRAEAFLKSIGKWKD